MIGAIFLIFLLYFINQGIGNRFKKKHPFFSGKLMNRLFAYHIFFIIVYYTYASFNPSDSKRYFGVPQRGDFSWFHFFGTGTTFMDFLAYPFVNYLNFSYEMMMVLFGWLGYIGFMYAYLFFRESIPLKIKVFKRVDLLTLILFFPNMHFWTSSLGKGSVIFLGLMMFAYAIKQPKSRAITLLLGSFIVYSVRPHMFLFIAVGAVISLLTDSKNVSISKKVFMSFLMLGTLLFVQDKILAVAGLQDSENLINGFQDFSEDQAEGLARSGSGVDMSSYPLPLKLFTFWFRPLFFDAPGILGFITSVENLIYLLLFIKILKKDFIKFIFKSPFMVKMSIIVFISGSLALSFVMSNLGIIIRQKSMVWYFLFFVIYYYLAQKKYDNILRLKKIRRKRELELKKENIVTF